MYDNWTWFRASMRNLTSDRLVLDQPGRVFLVALDSICAWELRLPWCDVASTKEERRCPTPQVQRPLRRCACRVLRAPCRHPPREKKLSGCRCSSWWHNSGWLQTCVGVEAHATRLVAWDMKVSRAAGGVVGIAAAAWAGQVRRKGGEEVVHEVGADVWRDDDRQDTRFGKPTVT